MSAESKVDDGKIFAVAFCTAPGGASTKITESLNVAKGNRGRVIGGSCPQKYPYNLEFENCEPVLSTVGCPDCSFNNDRAKRLELQWRALIGAEFTE